MARIVLDANESFTVGVGGNTFLGRPGGDEALLFPPGARGAVTDANIDRVSTALPLSGHSFRAGPDGLEIAAVDGPRLMTIPSLNGVLALRTTDGNIALRQTGAREFTAFNPNDPSDTAIIGADAVTPDIGTGVLSSLPEVGRAPEISVSANGPLSEGETARFTVRSVPAPELEAVTVDYAIALDGGAMSADIGDIMVGGQATDSREGTLTFAPGETETTIEIPVLPDSDDMERGEAISIELSNVESGGAVLGQARASAGIGGGPLAFELNAVTERAFEGEMVTYEIVAPGAVAEDTDVEVRVEPADPNAPDQGTRQTNLNDFRSGQFNPITTTIPAGETSARVDVGTRRDTITELPEAFVVAAEVNGETLTLSDTLLDGRATGRVFTLTPLSDRFGPTAADPADQPTEGDDTFRDVNDGDLTTDDVIRAGGGDADMIDATLAPDGTDDVLAPVLESVETVRLDATDGNAFIADDVVFDAGDTEGIQRIRIANLGDGNNTGTPPDTATVREIAAGTRVTFANANDTGGGSAATVRFRSDAGTVETATIALAGAALGDGTPNTNGLTVNNAEAVTLVAEGTANSRIDDLIADSARELTIGGSQGLTIANALANDAGDIESITIDSAADLTTGALGQELSVTAGDGGDTLDAGAMTRDVAASLAGGDDTITLGGGDDTVSGGAGADAIAVGGGDDAVDAGPGDDRITVGGNLTEDDAIDGGDGTDVIVAGGASLSADAGDDAALSALTGIEGVGLNDASSNLADDSLDLDQFGDAGQRFVIASGGQIDTATTVRGIDDGATVATAAPALFSAPLTLKVDGARNAGARDDAVTFRHATDVSVLGLNDVRLAVPGINRLNLESNDENPGASDGFNLFLGDEGGVETITISGQGATRIRAANAPNLASLETVDASSGGGATRLDFGGGNFAGGEGLAITGGAGNDIVTGTQFADAIMFGAGANTAIYDGNAFGASDRITDFGAAGDDDIRIDLAPFTMSTGAAGAPSTGNNAVLTTAATDSDAGALTSTGGNNSAARVFTTEQTSTFTSIALTAMNFANATAGNAAFLTSEAQLFTGFASRDALVGAVTSVANAVASTVDTAGGLAFGTTTGSNAIYLVRISDSDTNAANSANLTRVTNQIATIGSGTIAFDDIAIF